MRQWFRDWRDRLSTQLVLSHVFVASVVLGLALGIAGITFRQYLIRNQVHNLVERGSQISHVMQGYFSGTLYYGEALYLVQVLQGTLNDRVYVLDNIGQVLLETGSQHVPAEPWTAADLNAVLVRGSTIKGVVQSPNGGSEAMAGVPVSVDGNIAGGIFLESPLSVSNRTADSLTILLLIAELVAIFLVGILAYGVSRRLSKPLETLRKTVAQMEGGISDVRVEPQGPQEVQDLAQEFNKLADRIGLQVQQLTNEAEIRDALLAHVAHDLRTPLTSIRGFLEAIRDRVVEGPELERAVDIAYEETMRVTRLVDRLLAATRIRSGIGNLSPIQVSQWIKATLDRMEPLLVSSGHPILWDPQDDATIAGVFDYLVESLMNVIDNALKWSPASEPVDLETRLGNGVIRVRVKDHGPGIDEELLPHVFDRFVVGDPARGDSNGLGLAIVKEVVVQHGGQVWIENRPEGGAQVTMEFPIVGS